jgi:GDP-4-dehydro-6-deoxy-D-mannose reductase
MAYIGTAPARRVLITGATGFVGGWLAQELERHLPDAVLFGTAHRATGSEELPAGLILCPVDLTDRQAVVSVVSEAQPDVVYHLAGFASGAGTDREGIFRANVEGTVHLLETLQAQGKPCRVLLASSGYVYGATSPGRPAKETDPIAASGAYAESKVAMEAAARPFAETGQLSLTITRAFNHTGPRQGPDFVVPAFARQIARIENGEEQPVVRHGNLEALRDFLDVRDVVRAYRLLLFDIPPVPWRVVNVASGTGVEVRTLLERLIGLARVQVTDENDPVRMRPSDIPESIGDPALLRSLTGWQPEVLLDKTLADTLDWWRQQP